MPLFAVNGIYTGRTRAAPAAGPGLDRADRARADGADERLLDLRTGVLVRATARRRSRCAPCGSSSAARPRASMALRAEAAGPTWSPAARFRPPTDGAGMERADRGRGPTWPGPPTRPAAGSRSRPATGSRRPATASGWSSGWPPGWPTRPGRPTGSRPPPGWPSVETIGLRPTAGRAPGGVGLGGGPTPRSRIEGDPDDELAARFAIFHLLARRRTPARRRSAPAGSPGPPTAATCSGTPTCSSCPRSPPSARPRPGPCSSTGSAGCPRRAAAAAGAAVWAARGSRGSRPATGTDVTPRAASAGAHGELIPIRTGEHEEHIVADVAWAACRVRGLDRRHRASWRAPGATWSLDTARYWASRVRVDGDGRGHLDGVIGPDEYHEAVDDNAYTNVMARWNLRRAAAARRPARRRRRPRRTRWRQLAGVAGRRLGPGPRRVRAVRRLLGPRAAAHRRRRASHRSPPTSCSAPSGCAGSQLIKQADVLMLHHLVPDEVVPGSLAANLDFYEPRTAHGSSLSPGHPRRAVRPRRPARASARAVPPRGPARPRRSHRHHRRRPAPGHHGRGLAGARLRVPRAAPPGRAARRRSVPARRLGGAQPRGSGFRGDPSACAPATTTVTISCSRPVRVRIAGGPPAALPAAGRQLPPRRERPMRTVLAALDASAAARPVLETALGIGRAHRRHRRGGPRPGRSDRDPGVARRPRRRPAADPRRAGRRASLLGAVADPTCDRGGVRRPSHPRRPPSGRPHRAARARTGQQADRRRAARGRRRAAPAVPAPPACRSRAASSPRGRWPSRCARSSSRDVELVVLHVFTKRDRAARPRPTRPRPRALGRRVPRPLLPRTPPHRAAHRVGRQPRRRGVRASSTPTWSC